MRGAFSHWLQQLTPVAGMLACGTRGTDGAVASRSWTETFSEPSMDNVLRCVADLFQVIQHNRIATGRVRWVYGKALLHCERRADGTCLAVFTSRDANPELDAEGLERLFAEFRALGIAGPVEA